MNKHNRFPSMKRIKFQYGKVVGGYRIVKCIGSGGYSDIYYAIRLRDDFAVALKTESTTALKQSIQFEIDITNSLSDSSHVPQIYDTGTDGSTRYIAMELLGPSLMVLSHHIGGFSVPTTLRLAISMLEAVQAFHKCGFIHNDIKPENFLLKPPHDVKIIDFGFNKKYVDDDGDLLPRQLSSERVGGTLTYASTNLLRKQDTARRDDLFSWFYSVFILLYKKFPWDGEKETKKVVRMKKKFEKSEDYEKLPECLKNIYQHAKSLKFEDEPDYEYCYDEIQKQLEKDGVDKNLPYDWESLSNEEALKFSVFPLNGGSMPFQENEIIDVEETMRKQEEYKKKRQVERDRQKSSVCILI